MKTKRTILLLSLMAALPALAANQSTNTTTTASANISKTQIEPVLPAADNKLEPKKAKLEDRNKIMRVDGASSQAWTTIATRRSNNTVFQDCRVHEPDFRLLSLNW